MNIVIPSSASILSQLLLYRQFLLASFLFFDGGGFCFHCMVHVILDYGGNGYVVVSVCERFVAVVVGFDFRLRVFVKAWSGFNSYEEPFFENLLTSQYHCVRGYLLFPPINDIVGLVVAWRLAPFLSEMEAFTMSWSKRALVNLCPYLYILSQPLVSLAKLVPWGVCAKILR